MIRGSCWLGLLLGAAGLSAQTLAHAEGLNPASNCGKLYGIECGKGLAPTAGGSAMPMSAARSDAMKKRQLADMIRLNKDSLLREQAALMSSDHHLADRRL